MRSLWPAAHSRPPWSFILSVGCPGNVPNRSQAQCPPGHRLGDGNGDPGRHLRPAPVDEARLDDGVVVEDGQGGVATGQAEVRNGLPEGGRLADVHLELTHVGADGGGTRAVSSLEPSKTT